VELLDGVERGIEMTGVHAPHHVERLGRQAAGAALLLEVGGAAIRLVGEQIVLLDRRAVDAERAEQKRRGDAGAVLSGGAVEDDGIIRISDDAQELGEPVGMVEQDAAVFLLHQATHALAVDGRAGGAQRSELAAKRRLDRQRHPSHRRLAEGRAVAFLCCPQVDHGADAQRREPAPVVGVERIESVGAKDAAPAHALARAGSIAAEIAAVRRTAEAQYALR